MAELTEYEPTTVSPPGHTLADLLEERALTQAELAKRLGRPAKTINEIMQGKAAITSETAIQLEQALGTPAAFWMAREAHYREHLARTREDAELGQRHAPWLKEVCFSELVKLGWVENTKGTIARVRAALRFFGVANVDAWRTMYAEPITATAAFRKSPTFTSEIGPVAAWLRRGELEAEAIRTAPYSEVGFKARLRQLRALTSEGDPAIFIDRLCETCAQVGVAVVFVPAPRGCRASGATRWLTPSKALIQLSLRHKTNDHLWFTFFHEAGHVLLHGKRQRFIDIEGAAREEAEEREADSFARDRLIPPAAAVRLRTLSRSKAAVRAFATDLGIAPGIVVGRMQHEGLLPWSHLNDLKVRYEWKKPT